MKTRLNLPLCPLNTDLVLAGLLAMPGSGIAQSTDAAGPGNWNRPATWTTDLSVNSTDARLPHTGPVPLSGAGSTLTPAHTGLGQADRFEISDNVAVNGLGPKQVKRTQLLI